jgi:hypothetical protein
MQLHNSAGGRGRHLDDTLVEFELHESLFDLDTVARRDENGDDITAVGSFAELGKKYLERSEVARRR